VIAEAVERSLFLIDPETGAIFHLAAIGAATWDLLASRDLDATTDLLAQAFPDTPRATIAADVTALVDDLVARGLLITEPAPGRSLAKGV